MSETSVPIRKTELVGLKSAIDFSDGLYGRRVNVLIRQAADGADEVGIFIISAHFCGDLHDGVHPQVGGQRLQAGKPATQGAV